MAQLLLWLYLLRRVPNIWAKQNIVVLALQFYQQLLEDRLRPMLTPITSFMAQVREVLVKHQKEAAHVYLERSRADVETDLNRIKIVTLCQTRNRYRLSPSTSQALERLY